MKSFKNYWNNHGKTFTQNTVEASKKYVSDSQAAAREWARVVQQKSEDYRKTMPASLKNRFLTGIKIIIPLGIIIFLLVWIVGKIDNILQPFFISLLGRKIPGIGFIASVIIILIIGLSVSTLFGRKLVKFIERIILKIPIARSIYVGIQQIIDSFSSSKEQQAFLRVVLIEFPKAGMKTIGFVTNEYTNELGETLLNVFIPTAPNPTSGFLQIVKKTDVTPTSMSIDDAFKIVMSAGKLSTPSLGNKLEEK